MGGGQRYAETSIPFNTPPYRQMKWHTPLIIIASFLILLAIFGEPGTPSLSYAADTTLTAVDNTNHTFTYTVTLTVRNTGTAAADATIVTVYLTTPPGAPEWQQAEVFFHAGRIAAGEQTVLTDTAALTVGKETASLFTNGTLPETTIVGTYTDAFF